LINAVGLGWDGAIISRDVTSGTPNDDVTQRQRCVSTVRWQVRQRT